MYRLILLIALLVSLVSCGEDTVYVKSYHGVEVGYTGSYTVYSVIDNNKALTFPLIDCDDDNSIAVTSGDKVKLAIKLPDGSIKLLWIDRSEVPILCKETKESQITMSKAMFLHIVLGMDIKDRLIEDIVIGLPKDLIDKAYIIL